MSRIAQLLESFGQVAAHPRAELDRVLASGQKAIGCMPMYCPQELVIAAGMRSFAVWGADTEVSLAKRYYPAFICSVLQTSLELGLRGSLDGLSGMMISALCDSLKCMGQNWKAALPQIPFIPVYHPQNRKTEAGVAFLRSEYARVLAQLEEIAGQPVAPQAIHDAIEACNAQRVAMQRFLSTASRYPQHISPSSRSAVIKSAGFMDVLEHTALVSELTAALEALPEEKWPGRRVITTGILADSPALLAIFEERGLAIAGDDVAAESRRFRTLVPGGNDPLERLARQLSAYEGCSVLFDPEKKRGEMLLALARETGADGIVVLMTKFCDPEEFDYAILGRQFRAAGVPHTVIEVDRQMQGYGQARTTLETFCEML